MQLSVKVKIKTQTDASEDPQPGNIGVLNAGNSPHSQMWKMLLRGNFIVKLEGRGMVMNSLTCDIWSEQPPYSMWSPGQHVTGGKGPGRLKVGVSLNCSLTCTSTHTHFTHSSYSVGERLFVLHSVC